MRCLLEDRAGQWPNWRRVHRGEMRSHWLAFLFHQLSDVEDRMDRYGVLTSCDAALLAELTRVEVWFVIDVLLHPVPAVFLHYVMEQPEGCVIVGGIGRHRLAAELGPKKIECGVRHISRADV